MGEGQDREADPHREAAEAIAQVVDSVVEVAATIAVQRIWAEVPAYAGNPDAALRQDVQTHCRHIFGVLAVTLRERRPATSADFPFTAASAGHRVEHGIGLADFLRAYQLAQASLWQELRRALLADPQLREHALDVVADVMAVIEAGSVAAATAHLEAEQYRVADHDRVRRDLLDDLLVGRGPVTAPRLALLRGLGLAAFAAVGPSGRGPTGEADLPAALARAAARLAGDGIDLRIGLSAPHERWSDGPTAYQEACVARGASGRRRRVVVLGSLTPGQYLTLRDDPTARRLIDPRLRQFIEDDLAGAGDFVDTVRAFAEADLNAKLAAVALDVHPNTVYHRLDRIHERTGRDPRRFADLDELLTAIRLLRRAD